ncbi:threonine/serine ThrE exporter family protein [Mycolicibacterium thermoresistibile]
MTQDHTSGRARIRGGLRLALRGARDPAPAAGQRRAAGGLDELHTRKVLDLTIRLAEVMLSSGSGTADVVATAQDVAEAYQILDCVVDITFTTIIVSALPSTEHPPVTIVRSVRTRSTDYTRLANLDRLVREITSGGVSVHQAHEAMDELSEQPHPYPRWLATAGWAGFAFGIAMLMGGTWITCILAALTSAVIDRSNRLLNRAGTPFFFQQVVGAAIATVVAVAAYEFAEQGVTTLVATGIVVLLAGMTLVGSMQDALTGYMITALARLGDAVFLTAGIVVGILAGLQLASLAGVEIELRVDVGESFLVPTDPRTITIAVIGAAMAGVCLTIACYSPLRSAPITGVAAALAASVIFAVGAAGLGQIMATFIAAITVGLLATLVSIRRQAPALVIATAGITPLLPGLAVFRAVFAFAVEGRFNEGLAQLLTASAIALGIGSGVVLGELVGSPLRYGAGRVGTFFRKEGPPGLRRGVGRVVRLRPSKAAAPAPGGKLEPRLRSLALEPESELDSEAEEAGSDDRVEDRPDTERPQPERNGEYLDR